MRRVLLASQIVARLCRGDDVVLVVGGNSSGQAAVFLVAHAARVHVLVRGNGLASTMSTYLVEFIGATPNTSWLGDCGVQVDEAGVVMTGLDVMLARCRVTGRMLNLDGTVHVQHETETTMPGVFATSDERAGSTKRVTVAVCEGAAVVAEAMPTDAGPTNCRRIAWTRGHRQRADRGPPPVKSHRPILQQQRSREAERTATSYRSGWDNEQFIKG
jgi:thioredoxin reductase